MKVPCGSAGKASSSQRALALTASAGAIAADVRMILLRMEGAGTRFAAKFSPGMYISTDNQSTSRYTPLPPPVRPAHHNIAGPRCTGEPSGRTPNGASSACATTIPDQGVIPRTNAPGRCACTARASRQERSARSKWIAACPGIPNSVSAGSCNRTVKLRGVWSRARPGRSRAAQATPHPSACRRSKAALTGAAHG